MQSLLGGQANISSTVGVGANDSRRSHRSPTPPHRRRPIRHRLQSLGARWNRNYYTVVLDACRLGRRLSSPPILIYTMRDCHHHCIRVTGVAPNRPHAHISTACRITMYSSWHYPLFRVALIHPISRIIFLASGLFRYLDSLLPASTPTETSANQLRHSRHNSHHPNSSPRYPHRTLRAFHSISKHQRPNRINRNRSGALNRATHHRHAAPNPPSTGAPHRPASPPRSRNHPTGRRQPTFAPRA